MPAGKLALVMTPTPGVIKLKYALLSFCLLAALLLQGCRREKTAHSYLAVPPVSDTVTQSSTTGSESLFTTETIFDNDADADVWETGSQSADKENSDTSSKTVSKQISSKPISSASLSSHSATDSRATLVPDKEVFH